MNAWEYIITLPLAAAWTYLAFGYGRFWMVGPFLDSPPGDLPSWPSVCAVVPARNEAEVLPDSLPGLLKQDYPGWLQVRLVDDHSVDGTARIAGELSAKEQGRVSFQVVLANPLEPGWTGKLWALEQGVRAGSVELPDYFLFTDADIRHSPSNVRELVAWAEKHSLDLVSLMVRLRCESFWERLLIPAFVFFFQKLYPFAWVNRPSSGTAAAAGGCVLIRSSALRKIGGLAAVRSALIDDCALARVVKRSGGEIWLGLTRTETSLREYDTLSSIWKMVARTAFTQLGYSGVALIGTLVGLFWLYLWGPLLFLLGAVTGNAQRMFLGAFVWGIMACLYRPMVRFYRVSLIYAFSLPIVAALYGGMTFHSAWLHWKGAGGQWKGRSY